MRVAIFVVVVAAHVIMLLLLPSTRRLVSAGDEVESAWVPIFLPPVPEEREPQQRRAPAWQVTPQPSWAHRRQTAVSARDLSAPSRARSNGPQSSISQQTQREADLQQQSAPKPAPKAPDWRTQAEQSAQSIAQSIVEAEDATERKANALKSRFKPLPPPRVRGPEFGWDYAPTHRLVPLPQGGFAIALNNNCQLLVLPLPFIGCAIGKRKVNGDLFKYMHPPMKFGDWDKRDADP